MTTNGISSDISGIEFRQLHDEPLTRIWQNFQVSGMPDLISALHLCHSIHTASETGLFARIRDGRSSVNAGLLDGMNKRLGENLLRYLVLRGVLDEWAGTHRLTLRGELLTSEISLARLGFYLEAYGPVTDRFADLLTGDAVYGRDVHRSSGPLSRHCGTVFARYYTPIILEAMRDRGVSRILDLGCGAGQLLIDACVNNPDMTGVGLDIAPEAVEFARNSAKRHGVDDRLRFVVADAFDPGTWPDVCADAEVISGVGVLHEKLRDGNDSVVGILDAYAEVLTGARMLLIGEPEPWYDDRENDSEFFLVHALTDQGLPVNRQAWLDIIDESRLTCRQVLTWANAGPRMCFFDLVAQA